VERSKYESSMLANLVKKVNDRLLKRIANGE
jgi:hypothetical protein